MRIADLAGGLLLLAAMPASVWAQPAAGIDGTRPQVADRNGARPQVAAGVVGGNLLGEWMTEDHQGVVRIEPCGDAFCGRVVGISDFPPGGLKDNRGLPQCHLVIVHDLRPTDDGRRRGSITNPDDGRNYGALMWVPPDGDLRLRGYVGLPIFGSTQRWPHFAGKVTPDCHFSGK